MKLKSYYKILWKRNQPMLPYGGNWVGLIGHKTNKFWVRNSLYACLGEAAIHLTPSGHGLFDDIVEVRKTDILTPTLTYVKRNTGIRPVYRLTGIRAGTLVAIPMIGKKDKRQRQARQNQIEDPPKRDFRFVFRHQLSFWTSNWRVISMVSAQIVSGSRHDRAQGAYYTAQHRDSG